MEDYKTLYEQRIERAKEVYNRKDATDGEKITLETIFPELKESEDLKIKKGIQYAVRCAYGDNSDDTNSILAWLEKQGGITDKIIKRAKTEKQRVILTESDGNANIDWDCRSIYDVEALLCYGLEYIRNVEANKQSHKLEKQGEQKPTDKVEPKFKVGDWVQIDRGHVMKILEVKEVKEDVLCYKIFNWCGNESVRKISEIDSIAHLWTIQDAKNGDILCDCCEEYCNPLIFILNKFERVNFGLARLSNYSSYCFLTAGDRQKFKEGAYHHKHDIKPATKEQCDLLFSKMKEAGYEWDTKKKELNKVEQNPAWSEENNCYYDDICEILINLINSPKSNVNKDVVQKDLDWLMSIEKSQLKHSWSEEDEKKITGISMVLESWDSYHVSSAGLPSLIPEYLSWLKSLKERMKGE